MTNVNFVHISLSLSEKYSYFFLVFTTRILNDRISVWFGCLAKLLLLDYVMLVFRTYLNAVFEYLVKLMYSILKKKCSKVNVIKSICYISFKSKKLQFVKAFTFNLVTRGFCKYLTNLTEFSPYFLQ